MSVGDGIFWSTVILVTCFALYFVTKWRKWRTIGKAVLYLALAGLLIAGSVWGWIGYQNRPQVLDGLGGVSLGMKPVEVTLALGKPKADSLESNPDDRAMIYEDYAGQLYVLFSGHQEGEYRVSIICSERTGDKVFGLGKYSRESAVVKHLGNPGAVSVRANGLEKMISYPRWKVAFQIEKGSVTAVCVTRSGEVSFQDEQKQ